MYKKIKDSLIGRWNREVIVYILAGVATTLVNWVVYFIFKNFFSPTVSNVIAWALSVLFAYVVNSRLVFNAEAVSFANKVKRFLEFVFARVTSGVIESLSIFIFVEKLLLNDLIIKLIVNVFVIVFNYLVSKLWIFKRKGDESK